MKVIASGPAIYHVCPRNQTLVTRLGGKCLYPLGHLANQVKFSKAFRSVLDTQPVL